MKIIKKDRRSKKGESSLLLILTIVLSLLIIFGCSSTEKSEEDAFFSRLYLNKTGNEFVNGTLVTDVLMSLFFIRKDYHDKFPSEEKLEWLVNDINNDGYRDTIIKIRNNRKKLSRNKSPLIQGEAFETPLTKDFCFPKNLTRVCSLYDNSYVPGKKLDIEEVSLSYRGTHDNYSKRGKLLYNLDGKEDEIMNKEALFAASQYGLIGGYEYVIPVISSINIECTESSVYFTEGQIIGDALFSTTEKVPTRNCVYLKEYRYLLFNNLEDITNGVFENTRRFAPFIPLYFTKGDTETLYWSTGANPKLKGITKEFPKSWLRYEGWKDYHRIKDVIKVYGPLFTSEERLSIPIYF